MTSGCCQAGPSASQTHTSASLLRKREPLRTRPDTASVTIQTRPLPLLWHRRSSPAKFPSLSRPRVAFFMTHRRPSHPLSPLAVISCLDALRRHLPAEPPVLAGTTVMLAPSTQRQGPAQCLCFLLPCWHYVQPHLALQLTSLVPRRHGVLAHAHLPHGHVQCHLLANSSRTAVYGQPSLGIALMRGRWRPHCGLHRTCVLRLCTAPSCPFSPLMHATIRDVPSVL
jgi:hypothetical protein